MELKMKQYFIYMNCEDYLNDLYIYRFENLEEEEILLLEKYDYWVAEKITIPLTYAERYLNRIKK